MRKVSLHGKCIVLQLVDLKSIKYNFSIDGSLSDKKYGVHSYYEMTHEASKSTPSVFLRKFENYTNYIGTGPLLYLKL